MKLNVLEILNSSVTFSILMHGLTGKRLLSYVSGRAQVGIEIEVHIFNFLCSFCMLLKINILELLRK